MKAELSEEPVRLSYPDEVMAQAKDQTEDIISEAQKASERIRRSALQAAERERSAARMEATGLVESAKAEREKVFQEAREKAKVEAEQTIIDEFRPRIENAVQRLEETLCSAESAFNGVLERHKVDLVDLAVRIAEKVLLRQSKDDRDLVFRTACAALEKAREKQDVTLFVNPDDLAILEEYQTDLIAKFDDLKTIKMESDRRVDRGGVRIETSSGLIDARIRTQIDEIIKSLTSERQHEES
jgi:flagellar assembly protein FliH